MDLDKLKEEMRNPPPDRTDIRGFIDEMIGAVPEPEMRTFDDVKIVRTKDFCARACREYWKGCLYNEKRRGLDPNCCPWFRPKRHRR